MTGKTPSRNRSTKAGFEQRPAQGQAADRAHVGAASLQLGHRLDGIAADHFALRPRQRGLERRGEYDLALSGQIGHRLGLFRAPTIRASPLPTRSRRGTG